MKLRAFVFDAEPTVRLFLFECLKRRGYEVFAFPHGVSCNVCEGPACADVVITDVALSQGSGLEFLKKQREVGCQNQNMALTAGSWSHQDSERAHQLGYPILAKPFTHADLNQWLDVVEQDIAPDLKLNSYFLAHSPVAPDVSTSSESIDRN